MLHSLKDRWKYKVGEMKSKSDGRRLRVLDVGQLVM